MNTDEVIIAQLKKSFLFRGIPADALSVVAQKTRPRRLKPGEILMRRGEEGESLFMIHDGWVKIVTEDSKGDELMINRCGPGETIGEIALLDHSPRTASVISLTEAEVLELRRDDFIEFLDQRPDLALSVIRTFSMRLRFSTTYIQKAIEWSQKIAAGDYSFIEQSQPVPSPSGTDEDKASQLLSAFFQMVRSVKEREDQLKQQLKILTIEIDEARRRQEFEEITGTDFYANLKVQARILRARRKDQQ